MSDNHATKLKQINMAQENVQLYNRKQYISKMFYIHWFKQK
jgi:hypothetical protein